MVRAGQVMRVQRIYAKVVIEVAPHSMNVIGMILRVVVLDYKRRTLDAIVVRLAAFTAASPGEEDFLHSRRSEFRQFLVGQLLSQTASVELDEIGQHFPLCRA